MVTTREATTQSQSSGAAKHPTGALQEHCGEHTVFTFC